MNFKSALEEFQGQRNQRTSDEKTKNKKQALPHITFDLLTLRDLYL